MLHISWAPVFTYHTPVRKYYYDKTEVDVMGRACRKQRNGTAFLLESLKEIGHSEGLGIGSRKCSGKV
jgi:hypothetical protein